MSARDVTIEAVPIEHDDGSVVWERFRGSDQCGEMEAKWADLVYRTKHPRMVAMSLKLYVRRSELRRLLYEN